MKNKHKVWIWCIGLSVSLCIWWFWESKADFIEDNSIVTWPSICIFGVLLYCSYLATGKLYVFQDTFDEIDARIKNCEEQIHILNNMAISNSNLIDVINKKRQRKKPNKGTIKR